VRTLRRFFNEKWLELIISGICLPFLGAAVAVWLTSRPGALMAIAAVILVLLFLFLFLKEWRERRRQPQLGGERAFQIGRRGVIFTLGKYSAQPESIVYLVSKNLKPDFFGFLSTPELDKMKVVEEIVRTLGLREERYKVESWNLKEVREGKTKTALMIDWILNQGLSERELVLDITNGTATMSVAAFMAAEERRVDCQYILSEYTDSNRINHNAPKIPLLVTSYGEPAPHTGPPPLMNAENTAEQLRHVAADAARPLEQSK